ncbi:hypothetical protein [Dyella terrae]|uniref:hypothetical protein n=1 Tax=Dyella terrae TaxID=522259 RepID=UPI001EFE0601|nr:hypothetical protein [Dyella terrae]ULU23591.1 hypothetical protein DYST_00489 [Dyella terrae]
MDLLPLHAPDGYHWHVSRMVQTQALVPDGWFVHEGVTRDFSLLTISEDKPNEEGRFHRGLFVKFISGFSQRRGVSPIEHARQAMEQIRASEDVHFSRDVATSPNTVQLFATFRGKQPYPHGVHLMLMGDALYDEFRWVAFMAPAESWVEAWSHARCMFEHLLFWHPSDLDDLSESFSGAIH